MQQEINELKTINKTILFQRRKRSFHLISSVENKRHDISDTNVSILIKKSTKYFNSESFINCREDFK